MTTKRWCTKCGFHGVVFLHWRTQEHVGCGGKTIPIATICNPPEPTTIDKSDLAPGMVVVAVDDCGTASEPFLCSPDVIMYDDMYGEVMAERMRYLDEVDGLVVRRVAGDPC